MCDRARIDRRARGTSWSRVRVLTVKPYGILLHFPWKVRGPPTRHCRHFFFWGGVNTRVPRNARNDAQKKGHSKKHKGERVKSRVAFQGTIDRRKKSLSSKNPCNVQTTLSKSRLSVPREKQSRVEINKLF